MPFSAKLACAPVRSVFGQTSNCAASSPASPSSRSASAASAAMQPPALSPPTATAPPRRIAACRTTATASVDRRRPGMLRREPVVDREHLDARARGDPATQPVMRVEVAEHPHPAVQEDEQRARLVDRPVVPGRRPRGRPRRRRTQAAAPAGAARRARAPRGAALRRRGPWTAGCPATAIAYPGGRRVPNRPPRFRSNVGFARMASDETTRRALPRPPARPSPINPAPRRRAAPRTCSPSSTRRRSRPRSPAPPTA